jgi:quercetin dioxygenase-like cupin family protein
MSRFIAFIAALLLVLSTPGLVLAQEASPVAERMAEGVSLAILAEGVIDELPPGPMEIGFARLTFAPGTRIDLDPEPGAAFIAVESGTFTFTMTTVVQVAGVLVAGTPVATRVTTAGVAFTVGPGESVAFPAFAEGEVRNDGPEPVVALSVFLGPPEDATATPAAEATPGADEEEPEGLTFEPLAFGVVEQLPPGPAGIAIARVTIAPGATIPEHPQVGVEVGHSEAGSFTFRTAEGPAIQVVRGVAELASPDAVPTMEEAGPGQEVTVSAGDAFFVPIGSVFSGEAGGDTDAVALLAVVQPLGEMAATPEP